MIEFLIFLFFFTLHADKLATSFGGFTIRINNLIGLTLLFYFVMRFRMHFFSFEKKLLKALLVLVFSIFISCLLSSYTNRCVVFCGWLGLTLFCYFFLPYFLIMFFDERKILKLYFLSFMCVGVYGVLQLLASLVHLKDPFANQTFMGHFVRPNAFAYEPSYYALYMTPFVMIANLYYLCEKNRDFLIFKELKLVHILFINFFYLVSTSTSAFFAYMIFFAIVLCLTFVPSIHQKYPQLKKKMLSFGCLFAGMSVVFSIIFRKFAALFFMKFFFSNFKSHHSFSERWSGIEMGWQIFKENPFFGVGLGGFPSYYYDKWLAFKAKCYIKGDISTAPNPLKFFEPMNVFTEILASLGILGLLAFSFLFLIYFLKAKEAIQTEKNKETRDLYFAFFVSMLVTFIVLQFNQGILRTYIWTHFALTFAYFTKGIGNTEEKSIQLKAAI